MKIDQEKFYYFMENIGNTVSSTIPIALKEAYDTGQYLSGKKYLIAGFGVGYSWGGTILQL
jgi:3-oxoacyl-[acyl-carrier-protein] synthase-3